MSTFELCDKNDLQLSQEGCKCLIMFYHCQRHQSFYLEKVSKFVSKMKKHTRWDVLNSIHSCNSWDCGRIARNTQSIKDWRRFYRQYVQYNTQLFDANYWHWMSIVNLFISKKTLRLGGANCILHEILAQMISQLWIIYGCQSKIRGYNNNYWTCWGN